MKKILPFLICFFITLPGLSQRFRSNIINLEYKDLLKERNSGADDTTMVKVLNSLGAYHKFSRPDSGIYYATKGLELAQALSFREEELFALHNLALSYITLGDFITASRISLEGLRKTEEYNSKHEGWFLLNLGSVTYNSFNYEASRDYYQKAYIEFARIDNQNFLSISSAYLGRAHRVLGNLDSAFFYCYHAKRLAEMVNISWVKMYAYERIGEIHRDLQNTDSAFYYFKMSDSLSNVSSDKINGLLEIAKLFEATDQPDSAVYYAEKSLDMALDNKLFQHITRGAVFFSNFYEKSDPSKALLYSKMAMAYKDSLEFMSKMTGFADLINFDDLQRQAEIERANKEYQYKIRTYTFVGSILILLIVAFFLYKNNRAKHKSKLQIEGAYNQLKSTQSQLIQSEKMASLGELTAGIAHEIQNPLNFVNNFSEVNKELVKEAEDELAKGDIEETKAILKDLGENSEKINHHGKRADAIVKGMLQHSRSSTGTKEPTDINALVDEYLRLSYHGLRAKDKSFNASMETDYDKSIGNINIVPQDIGRVVLNLINNAFYAVNEQAKKSDDGYSPTVWVSTRRVRLPSGKKGVAAAIEIIVKDNGPGIPDSIKEKIFQPFFTTKPTGSGTGLGLSLSYDIVKAHGGELKVESAVEEGTLFSILLPHLIVNQL